MVEMESSPSLSNLISAEAVLLILPYLSLGRYQSSEQLTYGS